MPEAPPVTTATRDLLPLSCGIAPSFLVVLVLLVVLWVRW
ncbi:hypothetical protein GCM10009727_02380 [Actinomadura napierensis]|uniref:Uncharacterized protein n=1 Tax=Actinomadura napierensis TaxID=267854 RepID=A0ABN2XWX4_9ACTN